MRLKQNLHRMLAVALMGIVLGLYQHHNYATWNPHGKEAYMAQASRYFDYHMGHRESFIFIFSKAVVACATIIGAYEIMAALLANLLRSPNSPTGD